jgi:type I restriction enzyme S subunit
MSEWNLMRIGCFGNVVTGKTPPTADKSFYNGKIQFVTPSDLGFDSYRVNNVETRLSDKVRSSFRNQMLPKNAVMYTSIASIGKIGISDTECLTNQQINSIIVDEKMADYRFVYYLLKYITPFCQAITGGVATPIINKTAFERIKVFVPPLPTQTRIADILSAYDEAIENNNRRIALLEKAARVLYREWFVRMRFPGYENMQLVNGLPEGWEVKRLRDFGQIETGKTPPTENQDNYGDEIMFVKTPDMHGDVFVISTGEYITEKGHLTQPKKLLPANSIMVSCIGTGGVVAINAEEAHTNQQINSIVPEDKRHMEWLYFTCKNLKETIELFGATGTTMTNLSKGKFERLKVIQPQQPIIEAFHQKTKDMFIVIKMLMKQSQNLARQRDLFLPRMMSGMLEVQ